MTELLRREPHVISAGLGLLADAAEWQAARVTRVDWTPPMAGVEEDLVTVLADRRRAAANALAVERMFAVRAQLVDVLPARDALGLRPGQFLHAAPPTRTPPRAWPSGASSRWRPATPAARWARWPGWSRHRCGFSSSKTPRPGSGPAARSTRASARCCGTAPT